MEEVKMNKPWIKCSDKLPEYTGDEQIVIVSGLDDFGERYVYWAEAYAYGENDSVFSVPGWSDMNVTHWMPLPNPPKIKI
jgi:hypothetical protein